MRVCVTEFPDEDRLKQEAWDALVAYARAARPDLVVLPEMPFCEWIFVGELVDDSLWRAALASHDAMIGRLHELRCPWVLGSRPVEKGERRLNEAFVWSSDSGYRAIRSKWYLPDAPTARETVWFDRGDNVFGAVACGPVRVGFQLCSEMMFPEHSREIGWAGAHLLVQPRASGNGRRWRVASEMSAICSGAFVLSANRRSYTRDWFSGGGWVLSPEAAIVAVTSDLDPFVTAEIDVPLAERAKATYPRDLQKMYCNAARQIART